MIDIHKKCYYSMLFLGTGSLRVHCVKLCHIRTEIQNNFPFPVREVSVIAEPTLEHPALPFDRCTASVTRSSKRVTQIFVITPTEQQTVVFLVGLTHVTHQLGYVRPSLPHTSLTSSSGQSSWLRWVQKKSSTASAPLTLGLGAVVGCVGGAVAPGARVVVLNSSMLHSP